MPHWLEEKKFIGDPDKPIEDERGNISTLLTELVENADLEGVKIALDKIKANPNAALPDGTTPLMLAVHYKNKGIVKALLDAGADVNIADENGETALTVETDPATHKMLTDAKAKMEATEMEDEDREKRPISNVAGRRRKKTKRARRNKKTRRVAKK